MVVIGFHNPGIGLGAEHLMCGAYRLELTKRRKDSSLSGRRVFPFFCIFPREIPPVQIARIVPLIGIFVIAVVVSLSDFVARIDNRNAGQGEQKRVKHDVEADCAVQLPLIALIFRRLNAAERGCRTAKSCIADAGIVIVKLTPRVGAVEVAPEKVVQEALVSNLIDAELLQKVVVEAPADIIVAAQVVEE